jgi:NAD kinase
MAHFQRVGLFVKSDLDHCDEAVNIVLKELLEAGCNVSADSLTKKFLPKGLLSKDLDAPNIDLLLVIGGDGTILRAIRECAPACPVLSVNRGLVGFLTEMTLEEVPTLLPDFLQGKGISEQRVLLSIQAMRGKDVIFEGDVVLRGPSRAL